MRTETRIFIAFLTNLFFSVIELIGGIITGSVAIASDSLHDLGDAISIGLSFLLEKTSKKAPDSKYTYGYQRYSVLSGLIISSILFFGSIFVVISSVLRLFNPIQVRSGWMIIISVFGLFANLVAAFFTHGNGTLNLKAVNLHMLEDVLGWAAVLVGSVVIKFTGFYIIDPILSICVASFILINSIKGIRSAFDIFLEKSPDNVDISSLEAELLRLEGVEEIHHLHVWSIDGISTCATMHAVINGDAPGIKRGIKKALNKFSINHSTIETESQNDKCFERECKIEADEKCSHHVHCHHKH